MISAPPATRTGTDHRQEHPVDGPDHGAVRGSEVRSRSSTTDVDRASSSRACRTARVAARTGSRRRGSNGSVRRPPTVTSWSASRTPMILPLGYWVDTSTPEPPLRRTPATASTAVASDREAGPEGCREKRVRRRRSWSGQLRSLDPGPLAVAFAARCEAILHADVDLDDVQAGHLFDAVDHVSRMALEVSTIDTP